MECITYSLFQSSVLSPLPACRAVRLWVKSALNSEGSNVPAVPTSFRYPIICVSACLLLLFWAQNAASSATQTLLPQPAELAPDIQFWTRVYTEISSRQGFIHDNQHLNVVYTTLSLRPDISRKERNKIVGRIKDRYREILLKLARDSHKNLTSEERQVLELWPTHTSRKQLRLAAQNLRFQLGQSDHFAAGLRRSGRWLPYILATFAELGLPSELAALPLVESSYNPNAYSFIGAAGMWQFTRSTGRRFMRIDHVVDERLDPFMSTVAAARLLQHNHATTGSWPLAITAYNHGAAGMRRAVKQLGTADIDKIVRQYKGKRFKFASRNFYVAFLAAVHVQQNAEEYFGPLVMEMADNSVTMQLPKYITATALAAGLDIDVGQLKKLNPALRPPVWRGEKYVPRGFVLRVPQTVVADALNNGEAASTVLAKIPANHWFEQQLLDRYYTVKRGDSLSEIADRYGIRVSDLVAMNNLRSRHFIRVGQRLNLPQTAGAAVQQRHLQDGFYSVQVGDTLSDIATAFAVSEEHLVALNQLSNKNRIYQGQRLLITAAAAVSENPTEQSGVESTTVVAAADDAQQADVADAESTSPEFIALAEMSAVPAQESVTDIELSPADQQLAPAQPVGSHPPLSADPSDYSVRNNQTITVQAAETLGHYAEWLGIRAADLRKINRLRYGKPVVVGKRLKLDFTVVDAATFEQRRIAYHRDLQERYFLQHQITGTEEYVVQRGDSIWELTQQQYQIPLWLFRQYNPDINSNRLRPGAKLTMPQIVKRTG